MWNVVDVDLGARSWAFDVYFEPIEPPHYHLATLVFPLG